MATTTRVLDANVNGTVYTANANSALEALDTCHSGATAPTDELANGKLWLDTTTTPGILKIYNNAAWEVIHSGTVGIDDNATSTAMTLDASGNVLVGQTTADSTVVGMSLRPSGEIATTRDGASAISLNRKTSDGEIALFKKDGTTVGSIGAISGDVYMANNTRGFKINAGGNNVTPADGAGGSLDNVMDLGAASNRWDDIYATNGTINTSDENEKQEIAKLSPELMKVAARISKEFVSFKWNSSVEGKGKQARAHFGTIAQRVEAAFYAEGLSPWGYGVLTMGTWMESTDSGGVVTRYDTGDEDVAIPVGAELRVLLGVRYTELQSFIAAYNEQRFTALEERITALEA